MATRCLATIIEGMVNNQEHIAETMNEPMHFRDRSPTFRAIDVDGFPWEDTTGITLCGRYVEPNTKSWSRVTCRRCFAKGTQGIAIRMRCLRFKNMAIRPILTHIRGHVYPILFLLLGLAGLTLTFLLR